MTLTSFQAMNVVIRRCYRCCFSQI